MRIEITTLPGDGIGPEVTREAVNLLRIVADAFGHQFEVTEKKVGGAALVALSSGPYGPCGLDASGTVHCAGTLPPTSPAFTRLSVGTGYSCAITAAHVGYCWGRNDMGQLGIGTLTPYESNPVKVGGQP